MRTCVATGTVQCFDLQQAPEYRAQTATPPTCDHSATTAYYFTSNGQPLPSPTAWVANNAEASVSLPLFYMVGVAVDAPLLVLLYSGSTEGQPPTTFARYRSIFSLSALEQVLVPKSSSVVVYVEKRVRNPVSSNSASDCNQDAFDARVHLQELFPGPPDPTAGNMQQMVLSYNRMLEVHECHQPRYGVFQAIGIIGGGCAIVLGSTMLLTKASAYACGRYVPTGRDEHDIRAQLQQDSTPYAQM